MLAAGLVLAVPVGAWAQRFTAVLAENGHETPAGLLMLDPAGRLSVIAAPAGREGWLRRMVDEANAEPVMHVDAAPPAGAPRFAEASTPVRRGESGFTPALRVFLQRYYGVTLQEAGK